MQRYCIHLIVCLSLLALLLGQPAAAPVHGAPAPRPVAVPGDNFAIDDPFSSARTQWWRDAKFGLFIHWGLYSQLGGVYGPCRGAEWIMSECRIPYSTYSTYTSQFNPTSFDANAIATMAKNAGQKYIVVTSKHHEGFSMFDTNVNNYNIYDGTPFRRDPMRELANAARAQGLKFGFYYSIMDWRQEQTGIPWATYQAQMREQLRELLTNYGAIDVLWFDGEWVGAWDSIQGESLEAYVRSLQPNIIINNRVGKRGIAEGDYGTPEQFIPSGPVREHIWESCMTITDHWGYASYDSNFKSATTLIRNLIDITSKGGNYLLNVGPTGTGIVRAGEVSALQSMGAWLTENGEAIYGTNSTELVAQPSWGRVTRKGSKLYLMVYNWASPLHLTRRVPFTITGARVLKTGASVPVQASGDGFDLTLSGSAPSSHASVIVLDIATPAPATGSGTGLQGQYFSNTTFSGTPTLTRTDARVNFDWGSSGSPASTIATDNFSARWTGTIQPRYSEAYTFYTVSDDTVRLWINNQLVIDNTTPHAPTLNSGTISLTAGQQYPIRLEQTEQSGEAVIKLLWSSANQAEEVVPSSQLYPPGGGGGSTLNDTDPSIVYTGSWFTSSGRGLGDYNNDVHYTTVNGDSFQVAFSSTGVDYLSEKYSDQGLVDVYIDGVFKQTVDTTSATRQVQQVVYSIRGLAPGSHTLRAVKKSGTYMLLDAIRIVTTAPRVVNSVRFYPRTSWGSRMLGGKIQGSNTSATSGFVDLATIATTPPNSQWTTLNFSNTTVYRYIRYLAPNGGWGNVAELEFSASGARLTGTGFGTAGSYNNAGDTFDKALDGNTATAFDGPTDDGVYVGIDLGANP